MVPAAMHIPELDQSLRKKVAPSDDLGETDSMIKPIVAALVTLFDSNFTLLNADDVSTSECDKVSSATMENGAIVK